MSLTVLAIMTAHTIRMMKLTVLLMIPSAAKMMSTIIIGATAYCMGALTTAKTASMTKKMAIITRSPAICVDPAQNV